MYRIDTIRSYVILETHEVKPPSIWVKKLKNCKIIENKKTGEITITGYHGNLEVRINERRIRIKGSISKFIHGYNYHPLSTDDLRLFLETIESFFNIPLFRWIVTRLDIFLDIELGSPVSSYLYLIGGAKYKKEGFFRETMYLNTIGKRICFYDKGREIQKRKPKNISEEYLNKNILRIEFRILKNVSKHLKSLTKVTLDTLSEDSFYTLYTNYCLSEFDSIHFIAQNFNFKKVKSVKHFEEFLMCQGVEYLGFQEVSKIIKSLRTAKAFKHKTYYSRLLNKLRTKMKKHSDSNPLIQELKEKFYNTLNN